MHYPSNGNSGTEGQSAIGSTDDGYDRPPPKTNAELFNPKGAPRRATLGKTSPVDKENRVEGERSKVADTVTIPALTERLSGMSVDDELNRPPADCVDGVPAASAPTHEAVGVESSVNGSS